MGDGQRHVGVLFDHEDRHALPVDGLDRVKHQFHEQRREAHRRFIHADQLRPRHQRPANGDHLLFAAGECAGELVAPFLDAGEETVDALDIFLELGAARLGVGAHFKVFVDGHAREQAAGFQHRGNASPHPFGGGEAVNLLPLIRHGAACGADHAHDGLHGGGFAAGIAAEQADDFALADGVVHILQDMQVTVIGVDALEFEQRGFGHASVLPSGRDRRAALLRLFARHPAGPRRFCRRGRAR